jgi:D-serine deaminase-like pyridoxal phosphate-dependent protein
MADRVKAMGVRLRAHAKTHKSADIASSKAELVAFVVRRFQRLKH